MQGPATVQDPGAVIATKMALANGDIATLIAEEWREMSSTPPIGLSPAAHDVLELPPNAVFHITKVAPESAGFAFSMGAAFIIVVKFAAAHGPALAAKFGEGVAVAAGRELFAEVMKRIRNKRGADFIAQRSEAQPKQKPQQEPSE